MFGTESRHGQVDVGGRRPIGAIDIDFARWEPAFGGQCLHEVCKRRRLAEIIIDIGQVTADHGACNRQPHPVAASDAHDLDVFAPGRHLATAISSIGMLFNCEHELLERAQRGMADADRGIVAEGDIALLAVRKEHLEILGYWPGEHIDANVALRIQRVDIGAQPSLRTFNGNILDRNSFSSDLGCCAARQIDIDRAYDLPAAKLCNRAPAPQKGLVDVVVQDVAEAATVFTTESARERLGESVADRIRMAQALSLDDLCRLIGGFDRGNDEAVHSSQPFGTRPVGPKQSVYVSDRGL